MRIIESEQNPKYKIWQSLKTSKGIKKHGLCLISGEKFIPEIWPLVSEGASAICHEQPQLKNITVDSKNIFVLPKTLYNNLNPFTSNSALIITPTPELKIWSEGNPPVGLELLVGLSDPSNLGATLRSAEAFGVSKVVLLNESAHPFHPKTIKASSGSVFRLALHKGPSIRDLVRPCVALDSKGSSINDYSWPKDLRLLVGEEGQGLPEIVKEKSELIQIPIQDTVESLSAPIATSLALFSYSKQY